MDKHVGGVQVSDVVHDFQLMNLVDAVVGDGGTVDGEERAQVTTPSLNAQFNLDNPASYQKVGAGPNGADHVRLRDADGQPLSGHQLTSITLSAPSTPSGVPVHLRLVGIDRERHAVRIVPATTPSPISSADRQALSTFPEVVAVVDYDGVDDRDERPDTRNEPHSG